MTEFNARLAQLLDDMRETLVHANGAGLAAVQVGALWRACLVILGDDFLEVINPEILEQGNLKKGEEGCLSVPDFSIKLKRPQFVKIRAQDRYGQTFVRTLEKLSAVCMIHELDHMDGIILTDYCEVK